MICSGWRTLAAQKKAPQTRGLVGLPAVGAGLGHLFLKIASMTARKK